jgi:hypothetical protein
MRTMLKFSIPVEAGNEAIRTGKIGKVFEQLMQELSPEAAYFYADAGLRTGIIVFNMQDESGVVGAVERLSFGLRANVALTPVMTAEDLQKGLGGIEAILKNYD